MDHLKEMYGNEQRIVTVDIEAIKMNTEIYIRGFGEELTFRADRIHSPNESNWYASLISSEGHTVSISNSDGILFGEFHDEISSYNLSPINDDPNDDRYAITRHIFNEEITTKCGSDHSGSATSGHGNPTNGNGGSIGSEGNSSILPASTIDVLFLYTESGNYNDFANSLNHAMNQLNMIDDNSDIPDINFNLVGIDRIDYLENSTDNFDAIFSDMMTNAEVRDLRDAYGADIVLIGLNYSSESDTWGRAGTIDIDAENSIAVMQISKISRDHTLVHEAFHLFDCGHEVGASQPEPYQHAKYMGFWNKEHGTVMFNGGLDDETILYLSNPDVDYDPGLWNNEQPTGSAERDNARRANEVAGIVSEFRPSTFNSHVVTIGGGPNSSDLVYNFLTMFQNDLKYMYWVNPENIPPPYNAVWEFSTDGISYSPISWWSTLPFGFYMTQIQNGLAIQTNQSLVTGDYTIRLKVSNDSGTEGVDYMLLRLFNAPGLVGEDHGVYDTRSDAKRKQKVSIYPSIVQDGDAIINIESEFENQEFIINDSDGNYLSGGQVIANQIPINNLAQGVYYVSILSQNKRIFTQRIIVI